MYYVQPSANHSSSSADEDHAKSSRTTDASHSRKSASASTSSNAKASSSTDAPEKKEHKKDKGDKVSFHHCSSECVVLLVHLCTVVK